MNSLSDLRSEVSHCAKQAFGFAAKGHASEEIYSAALYTSSGYEYVYDTLSSKEGLHQVVAYYLEKRPGTSTDGLTRRLKWSPCDSPYYLEDEQLFEHCNNLLTSIWKSVADKPDEVADLVFREVHLAFIDSLREVKASGIFQSSCVVMLLAGDQSDESRYLNAEEINGAEACRGLARELELDSLRLGQMRADRWSGGYGA